MPNFLVGRILSGDDPASEAGSATVHTRIRAGLAVTPLGLDEPALHSLIYTEGAKTGFGRSKSLLCPHYLPKDGAENKGQYGVWKNCNAVCVTWFCKHERGAVGRTFWTSLQQLLTTAEKDLAAWCVAEMALNEAALKLLFPPLQPSGKDPPTGQCT